ncbi:MAG TPA: glutaredoxin family protein [Hydrogenophaga sp.]|nr:glutaredoxin family protein [Hydrogenophaga sp.]
MNVVPYSSHNTFKSASAWGKRVAGALLVVSMAPVLAQGVYRIVGPDGRVTFSDQPPAADVAPRTPSAAAPSTAGNAQLPFTLRQVVSRYPVTLYTSSDCAPCNSGRNLLNTRGIPYTEKTITTNHDTDALKRLSGDASLPLLTIGSQQIKGYSDTEWTQYLNAAGYPAQSALPTGYRRPDASPLVSAQAATPAAGERAPATSAGDQPPSPEPTVPVAPPVSNPSGIRF